MIPLIIGISSGLLVITFIALLKRIDKETIYGLILTGIGFIYVGFTWSDFGALTACSAQAIAFLFIAWYGIKKSMYVLAAGYFLHGCWDLIYRFMLNSNLIPPHYDLFCLSIDFTIGFYLIVIGRSRKKALLLR